MMNQFKQGDFVVCNVPIGINDAGDILEVKDDFVTSDGEWYAGEGYVNTGWLNKSGDGRFERMEKPSPKFNMKTMPWYIRVDNEAEYEAAIAFVESQGCVWGSNITRKWRSDKVAIGSNITNEYFCWLTEVETQTYKRKEIKLTFKTVVDSVEWPELKSQEQIEKEQAIASMREQIAKLQTELDKLEAL